MASQIRHENKNKLAFFIYTECKAKKIFAAKKRIWLVWLIGATIFQKISFVKMSLNIKAN